MEIKKIESVEDKIFGEAWKIYRESFPEDEQRELESQKKIFGKAGHSFCAAYAGTELCGLLETWDFPEFAFIEHIAIREDLRCRGLGTQLLSNFAKNCGKMALLETDRPETEIARRRIRFYEKIGFQLNRHDYVQPPYSPRKKPVKMYLMSCPKEIGPQEFEKIRNEIHLNVYWRRKPLLSVDFHAE